MPILFSGGMSKVWLIGEGRGKNLPICPNPPTTSHLVGHAVGGKGSWRSTVGEVNAWKIWLQISFGTFMIQTLLHVMGDYFPNWYVLEGERAIVFASQELAPSSET